MGKNVNTSTILKVVQNTFAWIKNVNLVIPKSVETLRNANFSRGMLVCISISYHTRKNLKTVL